MQNRPITANPSQIMIEQLAALGIKYVFYNSGSREAQFFDALQAHPDIDGILALHEGSVTAMAGGFTQVKLDPAVLVVHLGAGLFGTVCPHAHLLRGTYRAKQTDHRQSVADYDRATCRVRDKVRVL